MRKTGKKVLTSALISAMALSSLTGCGSKDSTTNEDGKTVISIYRDTFNLASADTAQVKKVEDAINKYLDEKGASYVITLTDIGSGEFKDKANLALANNEINLLWTASWMETINCDELVKRNAVYDITDLVKDTELYTSIPAWVWDASAYDGKTYFVSCYKESAEGYDVMVRSDLVQKYGWDLSTVKELKDLEPMLEQLKNEEGLKYPYLTQKTAMFHRYGLNDFDFFLQNSMMGVDRDSNSVVNVVQSPEYKEFVTLMCEWAEAGYLSEDDVTKTTTDTTTQTKDWGISWWTDVPNNGEADTRYKQDVDMIPITNKYSHSTTTLGSCFTVTANSTEEQAKACIDFLGKLYTDIKLADLYTFGIEGEDYTRTADGKVQKAETRKYDHSAWESCNVLTLSLEAAEPDDKVELYKNFNDTSVASCASGFRFDKTKVEAQYAACLNVYDQYGFVLENGGYAVSEIDSIIETYQKALDEAGYQDILKEAQAQYDAWKK